MNIHQIYSSLLSGNTLQIPFSSAESAELFRVKLAQYKLRQDKVMIEVGFISKEERQRFSFSTQLQLPPWPPIIATLVFKDRETLLQYEVKIVESEI